MTSKERVIAALTFQEYDQVPIERLDVIGTPYEYPGWFDGQINKKGKYRDGWGCIWEAAEDGVCGEVKFHPLAGSWDKLKDFKPPYDKLEQVKLFDIEKYCKEHSDKFIMNCWEPPMPNIFERMQHLRGTEQLYMDLAFGDEEVFQLRDILKEYYIKQLIMWCKTPIDAIHIHDDWGSQKSLLISPDMWREIFKPVYKEFCDIAHSYGKFVVMHSDGYIESIIPDLIEIGVNAINSQIFCMNIEELAQKYHHKICFWGEIDRQHIQVFGTPEDMRKAVRRLWNAFSQYGYTGFVAQCYYTMKVPQENQDAEYDEWCKIAKEMAEQRQHK